MIFHMLVRLYFGSGQVGTMATIIKDDLQINYPVLVRDAGSVNSGLLDHVLD
jgi:hypothetical protein